MSIFAALAAEAYFISLNELSRVEFVTVQELSFAVLVTWVGERCTKDIESHVTLLTSMSLTYNLANEPVSDKNLLPAPVNYPLLISILSILKP
jgi:hypothetical protein